MKILRSDLQGGREAAFSFTVTQQDIVDENNELGGRVSDSGLTVTGKAVLVNRKELAVAMKVTGAMIYPCARCLEPTPYECDFEYDEVIGIGEEAEELDLLPCVEECLFINEPYRVLCKEDCKGLCPHCGANLNQTECQCEDEVVIDPRLEALKKLL